MNFDDLLRPFEEKTVVIDIDTDTVHIQNLRTFLRSIRVTDTLLILELTADRMVSFRSEYAPEIDSRGRLICVNSRAESLSIEIYSALQAVTE